MRTTIGYTLFALILFFCSKSLHAQQVDTAALRQTVESKNYIFIAETASTMDGQTFQLPASQYSMRVIQDSVFATLPYYGRYFTVTRDISTAGGIEFASETSSYQSKYKKSRWQISIRPENVRSASTMMLTVFPNEMATLQVNSNDRESISFRGFILKL